MALWQFHGRLHSTYDKQDAVTSKQLPRVAGWFFVVPEPGVPVFERLEGADSINPACIGHGRVEVGSHRLPSMLPMRQVRLHSRKQNVIVIIGEVRWSALLLVGRALLLRLPLLAVVVLVVALVVVVLVGLLCVIPGLVLGWGTRSLWASGLGVGDTRLAAAGAD